MKKWRSVIALGLIILMVLGMLTTLLFGIRSYGVSDVSDMQSKLDALASKREKLEAELDAIADKKEAVLEQKSILDQQINDLNDEAALLNEMVADLADQLKESQAKLKEAQAALDDNTKLAKERIRAMYELGKTSYLEIILSSSSVHDFITRVELVKQMSAYDKKVIDQLSETKATIEQETNAISQKKAAQEKALSGLKSNVTTLEKKQKQSNALLNTFNEKTEENKKAIDAAEQAEAQLQAEIKEALSKSSNEAFVGGQFLWPVPGYYTITDPFGYRVHPITGVYKMHTGVDIAGSGIRGKAILAANSGKILKAGYNTAYGNYVVIDHGGGYSTLYGHASSLTVSAGQAVSRGDVIGYVGSTGYSTGPHLHFEIIQNGTYLDPLSFFNYNFTHA